MHYEILHVVEPELINRQMIYQTSANDLYKKHILGLKVDKLMLSLITSKPRHRKECQHKYTLKCYWSVYFIPFSYLMCRPYLQCTFTDASHSVIYMYTCMWSNNPLKWMPQSRCSCRHVHEASFFKEFHACKGRGISQHSLNRQGAPARHARPQRHAVWEWKK